MVGDKLNKQYILITSSNFPAGGAPANYLNLFCKGLKLNQYNISVLLLKGFSFGDFTTSHNRKNVTAEGVPFTYLGFTKRSRKIALKIVDECGIFFNLFFHLVRQLPQRKSTTFLVYNNELHTNLIIYCFAKLFRIPLVSFVPEFYDKNVFEGSFLRRIKWYGFLFNFAYLNKWSYKLIVFSHYLREQYLKRGYPAADIILQPNLTDFDFWMTGNKTNTYTLGYSGTPTKENGLYDLFEAMSLLKKEGFETSLVVVGDNLHGRSLIPELKDYCAQLGIVDDVYFGGLVQLNEVKAFLSQCEILTLTRPSIIQTQAGFPTKLGEYFAAQKKVLVTNFGDIDKYFNEGDDLIIAKSGDVQDIASKIKWMLQNEMAAEEVTEAGYKKAKLMLEYKTSTKRIADLVV